MPSEWLKSDDPIPGNSYWWIRDDKGPLVITITKVTASGVNLAIWWDTWTDSVTWTRAEWTAALPCLADYHEPLNAKDLTAYEELCPKCNGSRWEHTQSHEIVPCIWCNFTGKRKKDQSAKITHTQRSPLHPKVPVEEGP